MVRSHAPVRQNTALRLPPELDQLGVVFVDAAQHPQQRTRQSPSRTGLPYGLHNPLLVGTCDQGDARTRRRERADGEGRRRGPHSTSAPHAIASSSARSPPPTMSIGNATSLACVEWRITAAAAAAATTRHPRAYGTTSIHTSICVQPPHAVRIINKSASSTGLCNTARHICNTMLRHRTACCSTTQYNLLQHSVRRACRYKSASMTGSIS